MKRVLFELLEGNFGDYLDLFLLSLELVRMLDNLTPETTCFRAQILIFLPFCAFEGIFVLVKSSLSESSYLFLHDLVDKFGDILLKLIGVLDVALDQNTQT